MAETIALPAAGAGYAASFAAVFRPSFGAAGSGASAGSSFSSALRSAQRDQQPRSSRDDDDRVTDYAGAAAAATQAQPQAQAQQPAGDSETDGAPAAGDNGAAGQAKDTALTALQGRMVTLLAAQAGTAAPAASAPTAGTPASAGQTTPPAATLPASSADTATSAATPQPQPEAPEDASMELVDATPALAAIAERLAPALHGVQLQLTANAGAQPEPQTDAPHGQTQKEKAATTAAFAGVPATRAAHPPAQGAWAPAHHPGAVTAAATTTAAPTHTASASATAAAPPATQPRPNQPPSRTAAPSATSAWASAGTRQADGSGATTPVKAIDQVADGLVMTVRQGKSEATISLQPASLGSVKVQLSTGQDGLVIRLSAEHDATGDLLRAHMGELREALAGQQIAVSELHVLHNPPAPAAAGGQNAPNDGFAWQERPKANQENPNQGDGNARSDQDAGDDAEHE